MRSGPDVPSELGVPMCEVLVRVRFHEVDALGHVNNSAYMNYLEQAAIDHAMLQGLDLERLRRLGGLFVARRHEVLFMRPAHTGDLLRVITWLGEPYGARVERGYVVVKSPDADYGAPTGCRLLESPVPIAKEDLVVRAKTEWVFTSEQGRPRRIPKDVVLAFRAGQSSAEFLAGGSGAAHGT